MAEECVCVCLYSNGVMKPNEARKFSTFVVVVGNGGIHGIFNVSAQSVGAFARGVEYGCVCVCTVLS